MTTVVLQPSSGFDTEITDNNPTFNYGARDDFHAGQNSSAATWMGIIKFDLSSIPNDAVISSAVLSLYCTNEDSTTDYEIRAHRSLVDWFEGVKNGSAPDASQDGSTWNLRNANGSLAWAAAMGTADSNSNWATYTSGVTITGTNQFFDWTVTADVQDFIDGTYSNYGWFIRKPSPVVSSSRKYFASSDNATAANRPKLTITYTSASETSGSSAGSATVSGAISDLTHDTLVLQPSAGIDTMLNNSGVTFNYGASITIEAGVTTVGAATTKGIVKFDLSSIPANAIIFHAELSLYCTAEDSTADIDIGLRRALTQWYEGNSNGAAPGAGVDGSTWNLRNANGSLAWGAAGGLAGTDYNAVANASAFATITGTTQFFNWDVTQDVQKFYDGTYTNYGWWIISQSTASSSRKYFASSDNSTAANRPKLTIFYVVPQGNSTGLSSAAGQLSAKGYMEGLAEGIAVVQGYMISNQNALGQVAGTSTAVAFLRAHVFVKGNSFGDSTAVADIKASYHSVGSSVGISTAVAHLKGKFYLDGNIDGLGLLTATPSFQGQLRGFTSGIASVIAIGYARASGKAIPIGCNTVPLFYITDGTVKSNGQLNILNFLSERSGYLLKNYKPQIAQYKDGGRFSSSPQSQGRRLKSKTFDNCIDILELTATAPDQDALIQFQQDLIAFQEAASDYWTSQYALLPYYLVARAARETNTRYAVIHMISVPELENPYSQPFFNIQNSAFESLTVRIEHGLWLSTPPGKFDCVETSNQKEWTVSGWQTGS